MVDYGDSVARAGTVIGLIESQSLPAKVKVFSTTYIGIGMLRKNQLDFLCDSSVHAGLGADGKHLRDPLLPGLLAGL
jgi:hypothetical protein